MVSFIGAYPIGSEQREDDCRLTALEALSRLELLQVVGIEHVDTHKHTLGPVFNEGVVLALPSDRIGNFVPTLELTRVPQALGRFFATIASIEDGSVVVHDLPRITMLDTARPKTRLTAADVAQQKR